MGILKNGTFCPLIKKDCVGLICAWYTRVQGYDVNSGNQVDSYECAIAWLPMLLIENSGQQKQTGAAVESFRNEMVKANEVNTKLILAASSSGLQQPKLIRSIEE
ncbi:hypothetical protein UFOVP285_16 [uncultured Caudovirales phage]|uniref:Uncharacterized protein n=1 Tax=uncultured Caudovirales phage TaxID=2100421 RepID=A0A6J5LQV1_9CAUD|nr:hypothetical protein UFOVP285_16 [uncultured Caudovirales phage]